ncbi:MAG: hypothetical protein IPI35_22585 [Deltaproteobacteria bacterium]|nr:hypothetical protein [Deltaproteobacteria bacterium]
MTTARFDNPGASEICNDGVDNDCDGGASGCGFSNVFPLADCDATIVGASDYDHLGYGLYAAGDLDGDALGDLVIGAVSFKPSLNDAFVYAVRGDVTGTYDVGTSSASTLLTLDSEQGKDALGAGVGIAGDLTGDGINDLIAGAPYYVDSVYKAIYMGSTYVGPGRWAPQGSAGAPTYRRSPPRRSTDSTGPTRAAGVCTPYTTTPGTALMGAATSTATASTIW